MGQIHCSVTFDANFANICGANLDDTNICGADLNDKRRSVIVADRRYKSMAEVWNVEETELTSTDGVNAIKKKALCRRKPLSVPEDDLFSPSLENAVVHRTSIVSVPIPRAFRVGDSMISTLSFPESIPEKKLGRQSSLSIPEEKPSKV